MCGLHGPEEERAAGPRVCSLGGCSPETGIAREFSRSRAPRKHEKHGVWRRLPFPFQAREKVPARAKNKTEWIFTENLVETAKQRDSLTGNIYEISESMRKKCPL